ncbi:hypothetical protein DICSQDRAFT_59392, partial [Dichomitus squalens LYAD-421 SS1]
IILSPSLRTFLTLLIHSARAARATQRNRVPEDLAHKFPSRMRDLRRSCHARRQAHRPCACCLELYSHRHELHPHQKGRLLAGKLTLAGNNQFTHISTYVFGITVVRCISR